MMRIRIRRDGDLEGVIFLACQLGSSGPSSPYSSRSARSSHRGSSSSARSRSPRWPRPWSRPVGGAIWLQIVVFGVGSFAAVGLLRPIARRHLTMPHAIRTGAAALEGAKAIVLQRVDGRGGRVKIGERSGAPAPTMPDEAVRRRHGSRGRANPGRHSPGLQVENKKELNPAHGRRDRHHHRRAHRLRHAGADDPRQSRRPAPQSSSAWAAIRARSRPGSRWSSRSSTASGRPIDLREQVVSFPPQPVITEDNLVVSIDSVIYFQVTDPKSATYEIANYIQAIEQLTVTTLRNVIGGMALEKTLTSRDDDQRSAARRARRRRPASGASASTASS